MRVVQFFYELRGWFDENIWIESMNNILETSSKDGESIDHPWINKALERAQQKVEARNFDIRKRL